MPWPICFTIGTIPTHTNPCFSPCLNTLDTLGARSYLCLRIFTSALPSACNILPQTAMGWFLTSFGYFSVCLASIFNTAPLTFCNLPTCQHTCQIAILFLSAHPRIFIAYIFHFLFYLLPQKNTSLYMLRK